MVIAVGDGGLIAELLPELDRLLDRPLITLERVQVCKRDGAELAGLPHLADADPSGLGVWQKLMIHSGEQARSGDTPLHHALIRALRRSGAAGATSLRGIWGYHHGQEPHGDSFWQLRRRVPVLTVVVDTPQRIRRWYPRVDAVTAEAGLVTSEIVPAFRATGSGATHGNLSLGDLGDT